MGLKIQSIKAREVLDSRGFPTVEVDVALASGSFGGAIVPSGASTGQHEALELRDGDKSRFLGKGVLKAVGHVNGEIAKAFVGKTFDSIESLDKALIELDGTPNKSKFGANAILGVSLAWAKAQAADSKISLAQWIQLQCAGLGYQTKLSLPVPLMNVVNGGAHADNGLDIQEFMLVPHGFTRFSDALRAGTEIFHHLKAILKKQGLVTAVGDEGGFAPKLGSNEEALKLVSQAIEVSGYKLGDQISLALDVASTEFFADGVYKFTDASIGHVSGAQLVDVYAGWAKRYPIVSIEDGFSEDDWDSWVLATQKLGASMQLVGDDLFVTQVSRLKMGLEKKAANAVLIKLNQVGTLWETLKTMQLAERNDYNNIVSHRSGETEDTSLAHLVVGTGAGQVKTGSASRSDRMAKYNELLRLEELCGEGMKPLKKREKGERR
ncbi:MAG TPA: phosphopyruvate hydratase [Bdellovibrionota bacterium]|jgi:enolase|nr:phosphopyruvate hydratase [Bdellovibrionota bacterium]